MATIRSRMKLKNRGELVDYIPTGYQSELIEKMVEHDKDIILKSARQMGRNVTMFYIIRELCIKNPNYKSLVVFPDSHNAKHWSYLYTYNKENIKRILNYKIIFENGSEILFYPGKPVIGTTLERYDVFYDNYEFISKRILESILPCLKNCRNRLFIFTGNNEFNLSGYETIKWDYKLNENYDENWKQKMIRIIGEKSFKITYEVE